MVKLGLQAQDVHDEQVCVAAKQELLLFELHSDKLEVHVQSSYRPDNFVTFCADDEDFALARDVFVFHEYKNSFSFPAEDAFHRAQVHFSLFLDGQDTFLEYGTFVIAKNPVNKNAAGRLIRDGVEGQPLLRVETLSRDVGGPLDAILIAVSLALQY